MIHDYTITGMTCDSCEAKVKHKLLLVPGVSEVNVSRETSSGTLTMNDHIATDVLQDALGGNDSKYTITAGKTLKKDLEPKTWIETYKPVLLIFTYISGAVILVQLQNQRLDSMQAMRHFMAGFFLVFSFFKLLNVSAFADSYSMYDVVARKFPVWGYVYAFLELGLGIAFLGNIYPFATNMVTLLVMSVSIAGVLRSVLNKQRIQCACLGSVFNLPMSTITIIEDGLMILMSVAMLLMM